MTASGTAGHGAELARYGPLDRLGAVVVKSLAAEPWPGNPSPRLHEAPSGMLNSVGLQGPGVEAWLENDLPASRRRRRPGRRPHLGPDRRGLRQGGDGPRRGARRRGRRGGEPLVPQPGRRRHLFAQSPTATAEAIDAAHSCPTVHCGRSSRRTSPTSSRSPTPRPERGGGGDPREHGAGHGHRRRDPELPRSAPARAGRAVGTGDPSGRGAGRPRRACGPPGAPDRRRRRRCHAAPTRSSCCSPAPRPCRWERRPSPIPGAPWRVLDELRRWCPAHGVAGRQRVDRSRRMFEAPDELRRRLAIALDVDDLVAAERLARKVAPWFGVAKVGLELYAAAGPDAVASMADLGFEVFCDLKLHDIPTTVRRAARVLGGLGARYVTVHTVGGIDMVRAGVEGVLAGAEEGGWPAPVPLGVTVLTSEKEAPPEVLAERLDIAVRGGCRGVVCAASDLAVVRERAPEALTVVPGIRPADTAGRRSGPGGHARRGARRRGRHPRHRPPGVGRSRSGGRRRRAGRGRPVRRVRRPRLVPCTESITDPGGACLIGSIAWLSPRLSRRSSDRPPWPRPQPLVASRAELKEKLKMGSVNLEELLEQRRRRRHRRKDEGGRRARGDARSGQGQGATHHGRDRHQRDADAYAGSVSSSVGRCSKPSPPEQSPRRLAGHHLRAPRFGDEHGGPPSPQHELGLAHFDGGTIFRQLAADAGLTLAEFGRRAELHPEIDLEVDRRLAERAKEGGVVLESRLAGWIALNEGLDGLRVWLECREDVRARHGWRSGTGSTPSRRSRRTGPASDPSASGTAAYYGIDLDDLGRTTWCSTRRRPRRTSWSRRSWVRFGRLVGRPSEREVTARPWPGATTR